MDRITRIGVTLWVLLVLFSLVPAAALAHAGEEHEDPVSAVLHQGFASIAVMVGVLALVSVVAWWRKRAASTSGDHAGDDVL